MRLIAVATTATLLSSAIARPSLTSRACTWDTCKCTDNLKSDGATSSLSVLDRWNAVDCHGLWDATMAAWTKARNGGTTNNLNFSQWVSDYLGYGGNAECNISDLDNNCFADKVCGDGKYGGSAFIMNSLAQVSQHFRNLQSAVAGYGAQWDMTDFEDTFIDIPEEPDLLKVLDEIVAFGFSSLASPAFGKVLGQMSFFKDRSDAKDFIADHLADVLNKGIEAAGEQSTDDPEKAIDEADKKLEQTAKEVITLWSQTSIATLLKLFDGSDRSILTLGGLVDHGTQLPGKGGFVAGSNSYTGPDGQTWIAKALYAYMIPKAWSLGQEVYPVVLDSGAACGAVAPISQFVDEADGVKTFGCVDNRLYYLMQAGAGPTIDCSGGGDVGTSCTDLQFGMLKGTDSMQGGAWGGVRVVDLITAAVRGYQSHGNTNTGAWTDRSDPNVVAQLVKNGDNGIQTATYNGVPVCGAQYAFDRWNECASKNTKPPGYPCQPVGQCK